MGGKRVETWLPLAVIIDVSHARHSNRRRRKAIGKPVSRIKRLRSIIVAVLLLNLLHPRRMENGVALYFMALFEKVHRPPEYLEMLRLQMGHKVLLGIPFFKKKESISILDTLAEVAAPASLLHPYGTGQ